MPHFSGLEAAGEGQTVGRSGCQLLDRPGCCGAPQGHCSVASHLSLCPHLPAQWLAVLVALIQPGGKGGWGEGGQLQSPALWDQREAARRARLMESTGVLSINFHFAWSHTHTGPEKAET